MQRMFATVVGLTLLLPADAGSVPPPSPTDPAAVSAAASDIVEAHLAAQGATALAPACTVPTTVEPGRLIACYAFAGGSVEVGFLQVAADGTLVHLTDVAQLDRTLVKPDDAGLLEAFDDELGRILAEVAEDTLTSPGAAAQLGVTMSNVECDLPEPVVGIQFRCTAHGDDGQLWEFGVVVDQPDHVNVTSANPVG